MSYANAAYVHYSVIPSHNVLSASSQVSKEVSCFGFSLILFDTED